MCLPMCAVCPLPRKSLLWELAPSVSLNYPCSLLIGLVQLHVCQLRPLSLRAANPCNKSNSYAVAAHLVTSGSQNVLETWLGSKLSLSSNFWHRRPICSVWSKCASKKFTLLSLSLLELSCLGGRRILLQYKCLSCHYGACKGSAHSGEHTHTHKHTHTKRTHPHTHTHTKQTHQAHTHACAGAPSGLLTASYFARRGYNVEVFERRPHPALRAKPAGPDHPVVLSSR